MASKAWTLRTKTNNYFSPHLSNSDDGSEVIMKSHEKTKAKNHLLVQLFI